MQADQLLRQARRRAGVSQRELARRTGIAQPTIARIETGDAVPRVDTLNCLLQACGEELDALPRLGVGLDRTVIRGLLALSPAERMASLHAEGPMHHQMARARRKA
jgi:transcriptional regulator with XRE-family HTH domain